MRTLDRAIALGRDGLRVFPCLPGTKKPTLEKWPQLATTEIDQIEDWHWRDRLIGVPMGVQPNGGQIAVIDIDINDGNRGDEWFLQHDHHLLPTRVHETESGGLHLLFRTTENVRNNASKIADGVDVRGEGGYIIWWPAHGYEVFADIPLDRLPAWPSWLKVEHRPAPECRETKPHGGLIADSYQVERLAKFVAESRSGERNSRLYWAACRLAELHFLRTGFRYEAARQLAVAGVATGLERSEAERTIESAMGSIRGASL